MPPTVQVSQLITIHAAPLLPSTFSPFGSVIQNPGLSTSSSAATVNQGTAKRYSRITPLTNLYPVTKPRASANVNLFVCKPRELLPLPKPTRCPGIRGAVQTRQAAAESVPGEGIFQVKILERHPYSTQSFIPLGVPAPSAITTSTPKYLVIVAPSVDAPGSPPDILNLKAFIAYGDQGVTYAANTWHAPMVVLGEQEIKFVVLIHENGVGEDDCQEVLISEEGGGVKVRVDAGIGRGRGGLWGGNELVETKAKL